jgi:hypothetical protein
MYEWDDYEHEIQMQWELSATEIADIEEFKDYRNEFLEIKTADLNKKRNRFGACLNEQA